MNTATSTRTAITALRLYSITATAGVGGGTFTSAVVVRLLLQCYSVPTELVLHVQCATLVSLLRMMRAHPISLDAIIRLIDAINRIVDALTRRCIDAVIIIVEALLVDAWAPLINAQTLLIDV